MKLNSLFKQLFEAVGLYVVKKVEPGNVSVDVNLPARVVMPKKVHDQLVKKSGDIDEYVGKRKPPVDNLFRSEGVLDVSGRKPLSEVSWYKSSGTMAMADVMVVARVGLCSHQGYIEPGRFKMADEVGKIHRIGIDRLFMPTIKEVSKYWFNYHKNQDNDLIAKNFKR